MNPGDPTATAPGDDPAFATAAELYRALDPGNARAAEAWLVLALRHWFNETADFDPMSGQPLPLPFEEVCRRSDRAARLARGTPPCDRVARILGHAGSHVSRLLRGMNQRLLREHALLPIHAVRELDSASIAVLSRRPGRTIREKLAGRPVVYAPRRRWTPDTSENRLLKAFCADFGELLRQRLAGMPEPPAESENHAFVQASDIWLVGNVASQIGRWGNLPPNNVLLQHPDYRPIWNAWNRLHRLDEDIARDQRDLAAHWATALFWIIAASVRELPGVRLLAQPCFFDQENFGVRPALGITEPTLFLEGMLFPAKLPGRIQGTVTRTTLDQRGNKIGFLQLSSKETVFFARSLFRNPARFDETKVGTKLNFRLHRQEDGRLQARDIIPAKFCPFRLKLDGACVRLVFADGEAQTLAEIIAPSHPTRRVHLGRLTLPGVATPLHASEHAARAVATGFGADLLNGSSAPPDALTVEGVSHVALDLSSPRARYAGDGGEEGTLPYRLMRQFWTLPDQPPVEIDLADATGVSLHPDASVVSLLDLFDPGTTVPAERLRQAARGFGERLAQTFPATRLTYLVPDDADDFLLDPLRRGLNATLSVAPLPRSVAVAFDWQQSADFASCQIRDDDAVIVLDFSGRHLTATPLTARRHDGLAHAVPDTRGVYWERRPAVTVETISLIAVAERLLQQAGCPAPAALARWQGLPGLADEAGRLSWQGLDGHWFNQPLNPRIASLSITPAEVFAATEPGLVTRLRPDPARRVFVLTTGEGAPAAGMEAIPRGWLQAREARYVGHCAQPARGGCVHARWRAGAGELPLWRDHLPELRVRIARDGHYTSFYLVRDQTVSLVPGRAVPIEVRGDFVLEAGKPEFHFPLLKGDERDETRHEIFLRSPAVFPLRENLSLKLRLTYTYGADETYELIFEPLGKAPSGFKPLRAEWQAQPPSATALLYPEFPPVYTWADLTLFPTPDGTGTQDLLARIIRDTDRLASRLWDRATGEPTIPRLSKEHTEHLLKSMKPQLSFCFRTVWSGGHSLSDPEAEPDFCEAMNDTVDTLLRIMDWAGSGESNDPIDPAYNQFASHALLLLSCLHRDAPEPVFSRLCALTEEGSFSRKELERCASHIGLALGDVTLPPQRQLLDFVFGLIESRDRSLVTEGFRIFGLALWRHPGFWEPGLAGRLWHLMVASVAGRLASLCVRAVNRFVECHGARQGAAVAFYAAFSMAPLLVVVTSLMVWLLGDQNANSTMLDAVARLVGPSEAKALGDLLSSAPQAASRLLSRERAGFSIAAPVIAVVTMLVGAVGVFVELRASLQEMLGAEEERGSLWHLVQVRLLSMGVLLGCGFLLAVAMVLQTVALIAIRWAVGQTDLLDPALAPLLQLVELAWSWLVMTTLFSLLMVWLPDARLRARHAFIGAAVAAVLFLAGRYGINAYIAGTALRSTLGAAGSFAALLVWIYWSCQIFLLGAALAVELGAHERVPHPALVPTPGRVTGVMPGVRRRSRPASRPGPADSRLVRLLPSSKGCR